jgi:hypothetical protein
MYTGLGWGGKALVDGSSGLIRYSSPQSHRVTESEKTLNYKTRREKVYQAFGFLCDSVVEN